MNSTNRLILFSRTTTWNTKVRPLKIPSVQKPLGIRLMSTKTTYQPQNEQKNFLQAFSMVTDTLSNNSQFTEVPEVAAHIIKAIEYCHANGKKNRGLSTVFAYEAIEKPENITEESMQQARVLGWCVELIQTYFIVLDDVMDGSTTRRGGTCWHLLPDVGMGVLNDAGLMFMSLHQLLKVHLGHLPHYMDFVELFNETSLFTAGGQYLDMTITAKKGDYSLFTMEQFKNITKYKAGYWYRMPIKLAMLLANITDEATLKKAEEISLELGFNCQIENDYNDCFTDESVSLKKGTDIQEGKCTWLAVMALELANPTQKDMFIKYYGSKKPEHVKIIKDLYLELKLPKVLTEKKRLFCKDIIRKAEAFAKETGCPSKIFTGLLNYRVGSANFGNFRIKEHE